MLKIVYHICCGIDAHKSFIVACIATSNNQGVITYMSKRFSTFAGNLCAVQYGWQNMTTRMCACSPQESTGFPSIIFWNQPATLFLPTLSIVKAIRGKKTDKKDAKWIADIFKHDLISGSFILPTDIRQLIVIGKSTVSNVSDFSPTPHRA